MISFVDPVSPHEEKLDELKTSGKPSNGLTLRGSYASSHYIATA